MSDQTLPAGHLAMPRVAARRSAGGGGVLNVAYVVTFALVVAMVMIPILALVYGSFRTAAPGLPGEWTLRNYAGLTSPGVVATIGTTLFIGLLSSALCIVIGTAIALIVHRTDFKHGTLDHRARRARLLLPVLHPGDGLDHHRRARRHHQRRASTTISACPACASTSTRALGIVLVMVLHQVPFVYLTMRGPIIGMDGIYEEAARTVGRQAARR